MRYEYKNLSTGETFTLKDRLTEAEMAEQGVKRVWSVGFQIKSTDWGH